ncbi:unnamed protein product [Malus baccata var. baccata]|uniref:Uncharacterized protein n=3 Tax=Maleae TaxID=721813 RepID=A0A498J4P2_MALDO|nr:protein RSI-1 [Malus domestica]XP_048422273.1 protein RSI-1-like [Pyrus x bretschneideri]XP_050160529.1 protein RSI-1-like [Malus sylvestris]KAB2612377.1 protein RSI-1 [Pyrus ussuriensis x Pyrus communis]TQD71304.1 hypothetical protein C1H46_043160 [Malus baccata]RXH90578.1 hypothetical protein DVH24_035342 [Malus domestica]
MAASRYTSVLILVSLLVLLTFSHVAEAYKTLPQSACTPRCKNRCSATSHKKPCMFFCEKCCAKCKCVPPGVVGNKQMCPCYNNWKTQEGRPKCP